MDDPTDCAEQHPDMIACDDGVHYVSLRLDLSHYGWVMRRHPDGGFYSVREATKDEMKAAMVKRFFDQIPVIQLLRPHERLA